MQQDARALVHRWFEEVWNQGREELIEELLADDAIVYGLGEGEPPLHGRAGFKVFYRTMRSTFPDFRITIEDSVADGDKVAVRVVIEGTHTGDGMGVPPTGKKTRTAGIALIHVSNGKITAGWNAWNQLGLLRQIGALPDESGTDRFLSK